MYQNDSVTELDQNLHQLEEHFLRELHKIAEQRLKLEKQVISSFPTHVVTDSSTENCSDRTVCRETLTVRLEPSLGEKLAKTRGTSDGLEDRLQETRIAFEDKQKTVDRMKAELQRREKLLIGSIQQIEAYLRAVFYLKQDADNMCGPLLKKQEEQQRILQRLKKVNITLSNKEVSLSKALHTFELAKFHLQKLILGANGKYSSIGNLVEYYLVLQQLQEELLAEESHQSYQNDGEVLVRRDQKQSLSGRELSVALLSKEETHLRLKSELKNLRVQITDLEEQIDSATIGRVKDEAARYELEKWIQKLYLTSVEFRPPEKEATNTLEHLIGIRDFMVDALCVKERLKSD